MQLTWVMRYDKTMRIFRIIRVTTKGVWGSVDDPKTVPSRKWSFAVRCFPTIFPFRFRYDEAWGGSFA